MAKTFSGLGTTAGLAADRTSMTGMVAGQQFFETDTGIMYLYTGSAWSIFMPQATNFVYFETSNYLSTGSGSYVSTPLTATITKNYSSSNVLVQANATLAAYVNTAGESNCSARLIETGSSRTKDFLRVVRAYSTGGAIVNMSKCPLVWLDTQAGTGSRTYRLDIAMAGGVGTTVEFNAFSNGISLSNILLSEVF